LEWPRVRKPGFTGTGNFKVNKSYGEGGKASSRFFSFGERKAPTANVVVKLCNKAHKEKGGSIFQKTDREEKLRRRERRNMK